MDTRKKREKLIRKIKRHKRVSKFTLLVSISFVMATILICAMIYAKYQNTQDWSNTALNSKLADVPPEFAKNTYTIEMKSEMDILAKTNTILSDIEKQSGINESNINEITSFVKTANDILTKNHITSGETVDKLKLITMSIDVSNVINLSYTEPDSKRLSEILNRVVTENLNNEKTLYTTYISKLNQIATDYQSLNEFVNATLSMLGTQENDVYTINNTITQSETDTILSNASNNNLMKFQNISKFVDMLKSESWKTILNTNNQIQKVNDWNSYKAAFDALTKDQYYAISDIKTLADAEKHNMIISGNINKDGYKIMNASPIITVSLNGKTLTEKQYVRKDVALTATISPTYEYDASQHTIPTESSRGTTNASSETDKRTTTDSSNDSSTTQSTTNSSEDSTITTDNEPLQIVPEGH